MTCSERVVANVAPNRIERERLDDFYNAKHSLSVGLSEDGTDFGQQLATEKNDQS